MPLTAYFSRHAMDRVRQRLTMDLNEVAKLLDNGIGVDLGTEPGFNRRHFVFFSRTDRQHFVAVQDALTGTVVTVLPLEYHRNLAWTHPTAAHLAKAETLAEQMSVPVEPVSNATVFAVGGSYADENNHLKTANLLKWPARNYEGRFERLVRDPAFFDAVSQAATAKGLRGKIRSISIRLGNKGKLVWIALLDAPESAGVR